MGSGLDLIEVTYPDTGFQLDCSLKIVILGEEGFLQRQNFGGGLTPGGFASTKYEKE